MYEFLVRSISTCLVEGNQRSSSAALRIIRKHFKPGTELYREFRLINSLIRTTVTSENVASSIMQEAKLSARSYDEAALDKEKSYLIRAVNHTIKDPNFYDQQIDEYTMYATIQQLINDWRDPNRDLERMARFEDKLVSWLTFPKEEKVEETVSEESPGTNRLLMKIMMQKLNDKYSDVLSEQQKALVRAYAWSTTNDDQGTVRDKLTEVKSTLLSSIDEFTEQNPDDQYTNEQLTEAKGQLLAETLEDVGDETLTRFMLYLKLNDELMNGEDGNV
jgi:hypothetical protein